MPHEIPGPAEAVPMDRRRFFQRIAETVAGAGATVPGAAAEAGALQRRGPCPLPQRERLLAALRKLAARHGRTVPPEAYPRIRANEHCNGCGVCAGVCPTTALRIAAEEDRWRLEFTPARCVSCGRCEPACPPHALEFARSGEAGSADSPYVVSAGSIRQCHRCGQPYPDDGEAACPACRKNLTMALDLFGPLLASQQPEPRNSTELTRR